MSIKIGSYVIGKIIYGLLEKIHLLSRNFVIDYFFKISVYYLLDKIWQ
jgi:hypothetical protein